jgi:hypothetical protein
MRTRDTLQTIASSRRDGSCQFLQFEYVEQGLSRNSALVGK